MTDRPVLHDILVPRNSDSLRAVRVHNELCCAIKYDRILRLPVLVMKGDLSSARVEVPCENYPSLSKQCPCSLIILQTYLGSFDCFALEVAMRVSPFQRVILTIGTQFNKATVAGSTNGILTSKMPLIIPRNRWVQVVFNLSGIVTYLLELSPIESIETISLSGTCRASRLMMSNDEDEAINATPSSMALFAVPAYAPPIWQTAAAIASPEIINTSRTVNENTNVINLPGSRLAGIGEVSNEQRGTPLQRDDSAKLSISSPQVLPPERALLKLDVMSANQPLIPCEALQDNRGSSLQRGNTGTLSPPLLSLSLPTSPRRKVQLQHQEQVMSPLKSRTMSYIRLIDRTNPVSNRSGNPLTRNRSNPNSTARDPANAPGCLVSSTTAASAAAVPTGIADTYCGITGWGKAMDLVGCVNALSPYLDECPGKGSSQLYCKVSSEKGIVAGNTKSNNAADKNNSKAEQKKRTIELRRPPNVTLSRCRRGRIGADAQSSTDCDNTSSAAYAAKRGGRLLRRTYLRKRMKQLREAQVSSRRIHEMKKLPASELPIDPLEEALTMVEGETLDVMKEPRCGYGFGYLGVLHESGGFEADENADTRLKGALTLELSEEQEEEENDDDD